MHVRDGWRSSLGSGRRISRAASPALVALARPLDRKCQVIPVFHSCCRLSSIGSYSCAPCKQHITQSLLMSITKILTSMSLQNCRRNTRTHTSHTPQTHTSQTHTPERETVVSDSLTSDTVTRQRLSHRQFEGRVKATVGICHQSSRRKLHSYLSVHPATFTLCT